MTSERGSSEWRVGLGPDGKINVLSVGIGEKSLETLSSNAALGQQVADEEFAPALEHPAFEVGQGPVVLVDEAHHNFYTRSGRYQPFVRLLSRDGYVVNGTAQPFRRSSLQKANVLVIANAVGARNEPPFPPPIDSAFDDAEIGAVHTWVERGGSLFLIVDHFPWLDAARALAEAFGIHFGSGIAREPGLSGPLVFRRADQSLAEHPITHGRTESERVEEVATFTGSAFKVNSGAALMTFVSPRAIATTPKVFGRPSPDDPSVPIQCWLQGAALHIGKGRVAVFGEAAMFSAQRAGAERVFGKKNFLELYAVFSSPVLYRVETEALREVGSLEQNFVDGLVEEMSTFLLAGRAWLVVALNHSERLVRVCAAPRGKKPLWGGFLSQFLGFELCQQMKAILVSNDDYPFIDACGKAAVADWRHDLGELLRRKEPFQFDGSTLTWWTFAGGRINQTLKYALEWKGRWKVTSENCCLQIKGNGLSHAALSEQLQTLREPGFWTSPETRQRIPRARTRVPPEQVPAGVARCAAGGDGGGLPGRLPGDGQVPG